MNHRKVGVLRGSLFTVFYLGCATPEHMHNPKPEASRIGPSKTIVLIHGMFLTSSCWNGWDQYFQGLGYKVYAPSWPLHDVPLDQQRNASEGGELAKLTLDDVVAHYRKFLATLDEKPILIGHSMGGLVVQLLLQEGLGSAGIVLDSAPPKGILSFRWSFLKSNWGAINPFADMDEPLKPGQEDFNYAFVNGWHADRQVEMYNRYVVPESRRVGAAPTTDIAAIDFDRPRAPLLFIAGEDDHIIPPSLNASNYVAYEDSPSITEFRMFAGRTHFLIQQDGVEELQSFIAKWIEGNR